MKKHPNKTSTQRFKGKIPEKQARLIGFIIVLPVFFLLFYKIFSYIERNTVSAQQFVDLQQGDTVHPGFRRAHAKGSCISGVFESNGALSEYTTAAILQPGTFPIIGRFSVAGNDPTAPDLASPVRSLALSIIDAQPDAQNTEWRIAMNTPPVMAVSTPEAFYEQLHALSPNPTTQQRDPKKIQQFFNAHPETKAFLDWKESYVPANSFASETYHSINAFYLIDANNHKQAFRFNALPTQRSIEIAPIDDSDPDALQSQLSTMLANGNIIFDLVLTLAAEEDDETNPTIPWPAERISISAGSIVIQEYAEQRGGSCEHRNFDPLVLPKGIAPTADPILRARSAAYAESFRRRAKEVLLGAGE